MLSNGEAVVVACKETLRYGLFSWKLVSEPAPQGQKVDERFIVQGPESPSKGYDSSTSSSRSGRGRIEHDPAGRYSQRFDHGFGFSGGPYAIQPKYAPAVNYNSILLCPFGDDEK
ncbi:hypothetical protein IFM89_019046 [Coptis chinensis]|uniref:Uncharacterized protein n=1 Tax=Coptis chinensis TaxID=261450 RepID=A0A835IVY2_9MAGN|nr:hypothetical protein IFM89_019046 [Coptis chinensis]